MAVVGTAYVRVQLISDKMTSDLQDSMSKAFSGSNLDKIGKDAGDRIGKSIADSVGSSVSNKRVTVQTDADTSGAEAQIDALSRNRSVGIDTDLKSAETSAALTWLTRMRNVDIIPKLNTSSMSIIETAFMKLGGGSALKELGNTVRGFAQNIDKVAPMISGITTGLLGLVGVAGAATSNILGIVYSLGQMAPLALAMPGAIMGFAAGIITLAAVLKDAKKVLKDLGPEFKKLQDSMSAAFWAKAEAPFRSMVTTLMPVLRTELTNISTQFGTMFVAIDSAVSSAEGISAITGILQSTGKAVDIAAEGTGSWTAALLTLGQVGASYLPRLAGWANEVGRAFESWITEASATGEINRLIDGSIVQVKALGTILVQTVGIFEALGRAATAAGGASLTSLGEGLRSINAALSDTAGQTALITFFTASHAAMSAMVPGLQAFGASIRDSLIPGLSTILPQAGAAIGAVFALVGSILSQPIFIQGLVDITAGMTSMLNSFVGVGPEIGAALGAIGSAIGAVTTGIGTVLAAAKGAFGPLAVAAANIVTVLAPILSGILAGAINYVIAPLAILVGNILLWVSNNPALVAGIAGVAGALYAYGTAAVVAKTAMEALHRVQTIIAAGNLIGQLTSMSGAFGVLGSVLRASPLVWIGAIIIGLAAAFTAAYMQGGSFAAFIDGIGPKISGIIDVITGMVSGIAAALPALFTSIMAALPGIFSAVTSMATQLVTSVLQVLPQVIPAILSFLSVALPQLITQAATMFAQLIPVLVSTVTAAIPQLITLLTSIVTTIVTALTAAMQAIATAIPIILPQIITAVVGLVQAIVTILPLMIPILLQAAINLFTSLINALGVILPLVVTALLQLVNSLVSMIGTFVPLILQAAITLFTALVAAIPIILPAVIEGILQLITALVGVLPTMIPVLLSAAITLFTALIQSLAQILPAVISAVVQLITSVAGMIPTLIPVILAAALLLFMALVNAVPQILSALLAAARAVIMAVVAMIPTLVGTMLSAALNLFMAIVRAVPQILGSLLSAVSSVITSAASSVAAAAGRMMSSGVTMFLGIARGAPGALGSLLSAAASLISSVAGAIAAGAGRLVSAGVSLIMGLVSGIRSAAASVASAAASVVSGAIAAAKAALQINSPSRVFRKIGMSVGEGLAMGILDMSSTVSKASTQLVSAAIPTHMAPVALGVGIPRLASGGVVSAATGGTLALLAESRRNERVEPLDSQGLSARDRAIIKELAGNTGGSQYVLEAGAITVSARDMLEFNSLIEFLDNARVNMRKR